MKTLLYINTHPIFNRFNSKLKETLHRERIRVNVSKSIKPDTYILSVQDKDYNDGLRILLETRLNSGYNSLYKTYTESQKRKGLK